MITDLSKGKPDRILWSYTLPLFGSVVFQQLYNIADSVIAGRFLGEDALAAIGASYPMIGIYTAFAMGMNIGCSVVISRLFGAGRKREMKSAVSTSYLSAAALCVLLTVFGLLFSDRMLYLLGTPENIFSWGSSYLKIYTTGIAFVFFYNITTGIFTALGDSKTPFYFLVASSLGNIVLDYIFVLIFPKEQGVAGVAWATFIAQGIACVTAVIVLFVRLHGFVEGKTDFFTLPLLKSISAIAIPSILQNSFVSVGNLLIQVVVNRYDSSVIAGYSAAVKFTTFAITCFGAVSTAISAYTSQNLGAEKPERVPQGVRACILMNVLIMIPFILVYTLFGTCAMKIFLRESGMAMEVGKSFLRILSVFFPLVAAKLVTDGVLRGGGDVVGFTVGTFVELIARVAFAYLFSFLWGDATLIWWSWPIGWAIGSAISAAFYLSGRWKKRIL